MKNQGNTTLEQVLFNNTVSIEALLGALMQKGILTEQDFFAAKREVEQKIIDAQNRGQ